MSDEIIWKAIDKFICHTKDEEMIDGKFQEVYWVWEDNCEKAKYTQEELIQAVRKVLGGEAK
jgi:hypothetical protein